MSRYVYYVLVSVLMLSLFAGVIALFIVFDKPACPYILHARKMVFIQTAIKGEYDATVAAFDGVQFTCVENDMEFTRVKVGDKFAVVYLGGVGRDRSPKSAEYVLSNFEVKALLFSGIAGDLDDPVEIGKTYLPQVLWDDEGKVTRAAHDLILLVAHNHIPEAEFTTASLTVARFVGSDFARGVAITQGHHPALVDMEDYDVAIVAQNHGISFLPIRSISDAADGSQTLADYELAERNSAKAAYVIAKLVTESP